MDPEPTTTETDEIPIVPGVLVELPNGNRATVALQSGGSSLVGIGNASAWYPTAQLTAVPR